MPDPDDTDSTTKSALTRWDYTNDLITIAIVFNGLIVLDVYVAAVATGRVAPPSIGPVPTVVWGAVALAILTMAIWIWGRGAFEAARSLKR